MAEMSSSTNMVDLIPNRMALIIPPATAKAVKPKAKKKAPRKSREMVLKNFVDLPLDIIYETVAYLEPLDLLTLARLTKEFRALFMSRSSLSIWRRVLGDVPNLPPCPSDLSEPQYANLVFEKFCMACGSSRGTIETDYKTRLRFCATCTKANIIRGYELYNKCAGFTEIALTLIPYFSSPYFLQRELEFSSTKNELAMSYFKPEAELVVAKLAKYRDPTSAEYLSLVVQGQECATRMIQEGQTLLEYKVFVIQAREDAEEEMAERRCARIKEQMQALGWEPEYYPRWNDEDEYEKWDEYMYQPKEFTLRGWSLIRPKLTLIYNRTKQNRQMEALVERTLARYTAFRQSKSVEARRRLPLWGDLFTLEFMVQFFWKNYASCTDECLDELMLTIEHATQDYLEIVENDLARMIAQCDHTQVLKRPAWLVDIDMQHPSDFIFDIDSDDECEYAIRAIRNKLNARAKVAIATSRSATEDGANAAYAAYYSTSNFEGKGKTPLSSDKTPTDIASTSVAKGKGKAKAGLSLSAQEMLKRAANLFLCHCQSCMSELGNKRKAVAYPAVLDHVLELRFSSQHWGRARPSSNGDLLEAASDVLAALGLPEDCTRQEVDALGEFMCDCGHYQYAGPLSFDQIVDHVYQQQVLYTNVLSQMQIGHQNANFLVDGHSRHRVLSLVRVATDEDRIRSKESEEHSAGGRHTDIPIGKYCRYCYQLIYDGWPCVEMMDYHLKYMHDMEFHEDAFETMLVLRAKYGRAISHASLFYPFFIH